MKAHFVRLMEGGCELLNEFGDIDRRDPVPRKSSSCRRQHVAASVCRLICELIAQDLCVTFDPVQIYGVAARNDGVDLFEEGH